MCSQAKVRLPQHCRRQQGWDPWLRSCCSCCAPSPQPKLALVRAARMLLASLRWTRCALLPGLEHHLLDSNQGAAGKQARARRFQVKYTAERRSQVPMNLTDITAGLKYFTGVTPQPFWAILPGAGCTLPSAAVAVAYRPGSHRLAVLVQTARAGAVSELTLRTAQI